VPSTGVGGNETVEKSEESAVDVSLYKAAILDMDGVITKSAQVHRAAWKAMFDALLESRSSGTGDTFRPFSDDDYYLYVDGKPRYEGAQAFLESRGIQLPWGTPADAPDAETVCGLGNRKNEYFRRHLQQHGVEAYPSTVEFVSTFKRSGKPVAAVSASRNAKDILGAAHVYDLFDVVVDGMDSARLGLKGKPEPDIFLEAARQLGVDPARAILVEDAIAGVEAGRAGRFGLVVGIDRSGHGAELRTHGADIVVTDMSELEYEYS